MPKYCVLEDDKLCTNCGRCNMCDLDPEKVCDNCMRCLQRSKADYAEIMIDAVYDGGSAGGGRGIAVKRLACETRPECAKFGHSAVKEAMFARPAPGKLRLGELAFGRQRCFSTARIYLCVKVAAAFANR